MSAKAGRNDPCPCGSGEKAKRCGCGGRRNVAAPAFDPRPYVQPHSVSFSPEHRLVQVAAVLIPGDLTFVWLGYAVKTEQYFVYLKDSTGAYEYHEVPKRRVPALTRQWTEKLVGHVTLLRVRDAETVSAETWRDRANAVFEDIRVISTLFRTSPEPARPYLYIHGTDALARMAESAPSDVVDEQTAWMDAIAPRAGTMRLSADTTTELPRDDARWVRQLDRWEIPLRTGVLPWRFFIGQCIENVAQALKAPRRPTHIRPWHGELIRPTGERAEHVWLVSEHAGGRSVIDLTLLHPDLMGALIRQAHASGDPDADRVLDKAIDDARRYDALLETRVIGRVPPFWMYEGTAMDAAAFFAQFEENENGDGSRGAIAGTELDDGA